MKHLILPVIVIISVTYCNFSKTVDSDSSLNLPVSAIQCQQQQRAVDYCIQQYSPVCGWTRLPGQCTGQICKETFANSCFACKDKRIIYYTPDACNR